MPFDPDAYLADTSTSVQSQPSGFDPDAYLAEDKAEFDPDAYLGKSAETADPSVPTPESALKTAGREVSTNVVPALGGLGGGILGAQAGAALGALGGPAAPVTVPVGAVVGAIGGAIAGDAGVNKAQRAVLKAVKGQEWLDAQDSQQAANAAAHPVAAGIGAMVGDAPMMASGGGAAKAVGKAVFGTKAVGKAIEAGRLMRGADGAVKATKAATRADKALLNVGQEVGNMASFGAMGGGAVVKHAETNPDLNASDIMPEVAKGIAQGGVIGLMPGAKTLLGQLTRKPVTDAAALALSGAIYDRAVSGKPIDFNEVSAQAGESIPAFVLMNAAGALLHHPVALKNREHVDGVLRAYGVPEADIKGMTHENKVAVWDALHANMTPESAQKTLTDFTEKSSKALGQIRSADGYDFATETDPQRRLEKQIAFTESVRKRLAGDMNVRVYESGDRMVAENPELAGDPNARNSDGMYKDGTVHINLERMGKPSDIVSTVLHEAGTHAVLDKMDEATVNRVLAGVSRKTINAARERHPEAWRNTSPSPEEALAILREQSASNPTAYQQGVSTLRDHLRKVMPRLKLNDSDIAVLLHDNYKAMRAKAGGGTEAAPRLNAGVRSTADQRVADAAAREANAGAMEGALAKPEPKAVEPVAETLPPEAVLTNEKVAEVPKQGSETQQPVTGPQAVETPFNRPKEVQPVSQEQLPVGDMTKPVGEPQSTAEAVRPTGETVQPVQSEPVSSDIGQPAPEAVRAAVPERAQPTVETPAVAEKAPSGNAPEAVKPKRTRKSPFVREDVSKPAPEADTTAGRVPETVKTEQQAQGTSYKQLQARRNALVMDGAPIPLSLWKATNTIEVPNYVREGDRYVFKPTPQTKEATNAAQEGTDPSRDQGERQGTDVNGKAAEAGRGDSVAAGAGGQAPVKPPELMTPEEASVRFSPWNKVNVPEVSSPSPHSRVKLTYLTLNGPKTVNATTFWLPGYSGPTLAVSERAAPKGMREKLYIVHFADTGDVVESTSGTVDKNTALKTAVQRLRAWQEKTGKPATMAPHASSVLTGTRLKKPVNAAAVDAYGIKLPDGYVREGDRYVYRGESTISPESQSKELVDSSAPVAEPTAAASQSDARKRFLALGDNRQRAEAAIASKDKSALKAIDDEFKAFWKAEQGPTAEPPTKLTAAREKAAKRREAKFRRTAAEETDAEAWQRELRESGMTSGNRVQVPKSADPAVRREQIVRNSLYADSLTREERAPLLDRAQAEYDANPVEMAVKAARGGFSEDTSIDSARMVQVMNNSMLDAIKPTADETSKRLASSVLRAAQKKFTNVGRSLAMLRDPYMTPQGRRAELAKLLMLPDSILQDKMKKAAGNAAEEARLDAGNVDRLNRQIKALERVKVKGADGKEVPFDINGFTPEQLMDDMFMREAISRIKEERASLGDMAYEWWQNGILSSPVTLGIVNPVGNTANIALELGPQRVAEIMLGKAFGAEDAPTVRSTREGVKAMREAMSEAAKNFGITLKTEQPVLGEYADKFDMGDRAIKGLLGKVVRFPRNFLSATDQGFRTILMAYHIADLATRKYDKLVKSDPEAMKGKSLAEYQKEAAQRDTEIYAEAERIADRQLFQTKPGILGQIPLQARQSDNPFVKWGSKYLLPFVTTPANVIKTGARKSPLGSVPLAYKALRGEFSGTEAGKAEGVRLLGEQAVGWGIMGAVAALMDEDKDDPLGRPRITGTQQESGRSRPGAREYEKRNEPAMSVRIGNDWYSYKRIEPIASVLATVVDMLHAGQSVKDGKLGDAGERMAKTLVGMFSDRTYLKTVGDIIDAVRDNDPGAYMKIATGTLSGFNPNIVKTTLRAFDPTIRDMRNRAPKGTLEWLKESGERLVQQTLPTVAPQPIPLFDTAGRPVVKEGEGAAGVAERIFSPFQRQAADKLTAVDAMMKRYADAHPDESVLIAPPLLPEITLFGGKKVKANETEFAAYQQLAGQRAQQVLAGMKFNYDAPTERDVERVKKVYESARKYAKAQITRDVMKRMAAERKP